jgi:hypothetical protein
LSIGLAITEEIKQIRIHKSIDRNIGYNISPGGEYDCITGPKIFWDRMRDNPQEFNKYKDKLSMACKKRGGPNTQALLNYRANLSIREKWYGSYRALRIANKYGVKTTKSNKPMPHSTEYKNKMSLILKESWKKSPPSYKKLRSINSKKSAFAIWAARTDTDIKIVSQKISVSLKKKYKLDKQFKNNNSKQLSKVRNTIDREKQGKAASAGLKKFWAQLRKNPQQYEYYINRRKITLKNTLVDKKNEKTDI